jgi:transcriptional regulator with XRE-family HTH domain
MGGDDKVPVLRQMPDETLGLRQTFGASVRRRREALRLSQRAISRQHKVTQRIWSAIEAGSINMTLRTMARVANAVGADVPTLLVDGSD